ncbi:helix-turn-helix domain-containing protein [Bradyrhizobium sp. SZCCHNRI2010]|uniref:helix-turn-helix domain-containing protein n=1 Tax=Bradyrhizobium sp. SZCCHNRI2010 TaxID=3057283 RepID=UPI0028E29677|nr:helix-turn-helix domain-containing protein [Bradyrhizobium sp. SZCCHNRI2010]
MSHEAQTWAIKIDVRSREDDGKSQSGLARKAVLMYLANRANTEDGSSWPSQARVAQDLCCSERCVRNAMRDLEDMGIIRRKSRPGTSDLIFINFDYAPPAADAGRGPRRAPAGGAAAGDSGERRAGSDRQEMPEAPAGDSGGDRHEVPPNLQIEPSLNHQKEPSARKPRRTAPWPNDYKQQFWDLYPKRRNTSRKDAWIKLEKLEQEDRVEFADIMAGLKFYADRMNAEVRTNPKNEQFIAHAVTWLNQERWESETPSSPSEGRAGVQARIRARGVFV